MRPYFTLHFEQKLHLFVPAGRVRWLVFGYVQPGAPNDRPAGVDLGGAATC